jgi:hypothetical protein
MNLRTLNYSPNVNPLLLNNEPVIKRKRMVTSYANNLTDTATGEIHQTAAICTTEDVDPEQFVKLFPALIAATYDLTKTGLRVFQEVLTQYQNMKMSGGYAEDVSLFWFDGGLDGRALDMSEKTFQRGLKELLLNGFLSPRKPNVYWVNPALFFRGNRVRFIKEYRIKNTSETEIPHKILESNTNRQQRLID